MSWSKVNNKHCKPLKWWYHKVMCEFWYHIYLYRSFSQSKYYYHLNECIKTGYNIYGERI